ncbi:MAG: PA2169 family four-helix-bundle protein [Acidimicrobiales bacterium]|nr:PA2169 family four-helix-bundle protein [Actinomycetota bacterium]
MSNDAAVTKDLIKVLEDGRDGFATAADKLEADGEPELATTFRQRGQQRGAFADELQALAASYGDQIEESGTVAAAVHRGWLIVKDAIAGSDPKGVLDAAEQGEDHAVSAFRKAVADDLSTELRTVVERQQAEVLAAHNQIKALRDARS